MTITEREGKCGDVLKVGDCLLENMPEYQIT